MNWNQSLFEPLLRCGWTYSDELLSEETVQNWRDLLLKKRDEQLFRAAQLAQNGLNAEIRSDQIHWLEESDAGAQPVLQKLDEIRKAAQEFLWISLPHTEAHFAIYPSGSFYRRHCDQPLGNASRVLTFVIYLHDHWEPGYGGELVVTKGDTEQVLEIIEPKPKRVVIFKSDEVWHEVRKSSFDRYSLTGWFRNDFHIHSSSAKNHI